MAGHGSVGLVFSATARKRSCNRFAKFVLMLPSQILVIQVTYVTNLTLACAADVLFRMRFATGNAHHLTFRVRSGGGLLIISPGFNQSPVTPSEMMRPECSGNAAGTAKRLWVVSLAGFPTADIAARCYKGYVIPCRLNWQGNGRHSKAITNLGLCGLKVMRRWHAAAVYRWRDSIKPSELPVAFPYLNTPLPGGLSGGIMQQSFRDPQRRLSGCRNGWLLYNATGGPISGYHGMISSA
jgi:hypothetical protein